MENKITANYSKIIKNRSLVEQKFGTPTPNAKMEQLPWKGSLANCKNILDLGAGKEHIAKSFLNPESNYFSLDNDPEGQFDFSNIGQLYDEKYFEFFDGILASQYFEHLTWEDIEKHLQIIEKIAKKGCIFVVAIPNLFRLTSYINHYDHKTNLSYYDLSAFIMCYGFEILQAYAYDKKPQNIINATSFERDVMNVLDKFYQISPWRFVAAEARKI